MKRTHILSKSLILSGSLLLLLSVNPNKTQASTFIPPLQSFQTNTLSSGYVMASWSYRTFVDTGYIPSDNQIKFDFGSGSSKTFTEVKGTLIGENASSFTIVDAPPSTITGNNHTFYIELNPNLSAGTYSASLEIYSKETGKCMAKDFAITVRDTVSSSPDSNTTTPDSSTTTPDSSTTTPDSSTTTPDSSTTTPDSSTTTPDSSTTTPDSSTTTPDSSTTTPESSTTTPDSSTTTPESSTTSPDSSTTTPDSSTTTPDSSATAPDSSTTTPEVVEPEQETTPDVGTPNTSTGSNKLPTITQGSPLSTVPTSSNTQDKQNYSTKNSTITGNLVETSSGYTRLEKISDQDTILIEQYNDDFALTAISSVPMELASLVAFHEGENNYYIMFTQANSSESSSVEVVRVVKYDKYWNRQSATSISNINTVGGVSYADMAESDGNLLIHSCHTMYKASDGYNHQANLRFTIDIDSMKMLNQASNVWNSDSGYVSHSFNQLIDVSSDGFVVTADHGDAYPRSLALFAWKSNNIVTPYPTMAEVLKISGNTGNNTTKARFGGLQIGTSSVLLAGSSVTQNSSFASNTDYNVFVTATPRNNFSTSSSNITWITNYSGSTYASNPYLIEITEDKFILMWNELPLADSPVLCWTTIDGSGKQVGSIQRGVGNLSSVEPKVNSEGEIVWYSTKNTAPVFQVLNLNSNQIQTVDTSGVLVEETNPNLEENAPESEEITPELDSTTGNTEVSVPLTGASTWARDLITEASNIGILNNMNDVTSKYQTDITRQEFCRLIINVYESSGKIAPTGTNPFSDANNADVISAYTLGIVNGKSAHIFAPNDKITRQELAVMVVRTAEHFENITGLSETASFTDYSSVDSWAKTAVFYAQREGFLAGSNGKILPHDNLTCEEAIAVALRLAQTFGESNGNNTFTPEVQEENPMYESYLEKIKSMQSKYGTTGNNGFDQPATGLLSAELLDLDGNGKEELILKYVSNLEDASSYTYGITTTLAIYSYVDGKVAEIFSNDSSVYFGSNVTTSIDYFYIPYENKNLFGIKDEMLHMYNSYKDLSLYTYSGSGSLKETESLYVSYYNENNTTLFSWNINGSKSSTTGNGFPEYDDFSVLWEKVPQYAPKGVQELRNDYASCVAYLESF